MGLDIGADDYVVKPFSPSEVMARLRAILRRLDLNEGEHQQYVTRGSLDISSRFKNGKCIFKRTYSGLCMGLRLLWRRKDG